MVIDIKDENFRSFDPPSPVHNSLSNSGSLCQVADLYGESLHC